MSTIEQLGRDNVAAYAKQTAFAKNPNAQPSSETKQSDGVPKDTVTLSKDGEKIVNLARGNELSDEIRQKPVDKDFASFLQSAVADVKRISQVFSRTMHNLFASNRS